MSGWTIFLTAALCGIVVVTFLSIFANAVMTTEYALGKVERQAAREAAEREQAADLLVDEEIELAEEQVA